MQQKLTNNFFEIITFANIFGKTTGVPVVNIHNNSNKNIHIEMRNHNTHNDFLYVICDKQKIIGYNAKINKYRCASIFPVDFFEQIEIATLEFTENIKLSFHQDIKRFKLMRVHDYNDDEVRIAKKYYNTTHLKYKSINEFNKWRKESIPLIEYKPEEELISDIEDVEVL